MQEIAPFLLLRINGAMVDCALWQVEQGGRALALFLNEESASAYRDAAGLQGWQIVQPRREGLLSLLDAHVQAGVLLGVLDPDLRQGHRLFDLREVVRAASTAFAVDTPSQPRREASPPT